MLIAAANLMYLFFYLRDISLYYNVRKHFLRYLMAIRNSMICNFAFTCLNSISISLIYLAAIFL